jgi:hypothetical protein
LNHRPCPTPEARNGPKAALLGYAKPRPILSDPSHAQ